MHPAPFTNIVSDFLSLLCSIVSFRTLFIFPSIPDSHPVFFLSRTPVSRTRVFLESECGGGEMTVSCFHSLQMLTLPCYLFSGCPPCLETAGWTRTTSSSSFSLHTLAPAVLILPQTKNSSQHLYSCPPPSPKKRLLPVTRQHLLSRPA